jgi:hypothetical protein
MFPPGRAKLETRPDPHRIGDKRHHEGNRGGCLLDGQIRRRSFGRDDIHLEADQLGRETKQPFGLTLCVAVLDDDVLTFRVSKVSKTLPKPLAPEREIRRREDG